ncbi:MAG: hypothetical protein VB062_08860 [Christensenella sp.]|nr:hypothetical protein [Christensenella sp.]
MKRPVCNSMIARVVSAVFVLICVFAFMPSAHAEEARINIVANPSELTDSGTVTFTFEIANYNADYPMADVAITYNGTVYNVMNGQQIPPSGSASNITLTLNVSQSQLGKPISFLVTWTRNGEPMSQEATITVAQAENPIISVTRTASKTNVKPGEAITITYTIKNATKFDMTGITLIDENISDQPIFQDETLRASRSTSYDFTYTMGDESVTSAPLVTYSVNGKTKTFSSVEPLELTMVLIKLNMKIQAGVPTSSGVAFTIDVLNAGTQAINDITISDERGNAVNEAPFSLEAGESNTLSYLVVPLMTEPLRNVQFALKGTDPFGEAYEIKPTDADVYPVYPFVDASQISVTVRAETVTPWTAESGKLNARVVITNHSVVELTNITVSEATIGVVKNYDTLPAGETSFDQEIALGSPRNLSITVKGYDPTGTNRELASCVMPVAYGTDTPTPVEATTPPNSGNMTIFNGLNDGIAKILIILGVLMVFAFVILVVLTAMERSRMPKRFADDDADLDDYFEPQRTAGNDRRNYHDAPDPEEISYTKRMLSMRDDRPFGTVNGEPVRLPPAAPPRPAEQPRAMIPPQYEPASSPPRADEVADRLVQTAHSRYTEAESRAAYRPAREPAEPYTPHPQQMAQAAAPRVLEHKKQPKTQPKAKQSVTRVAKSARPYNDDEE